jgi:quaternary ammonium compound-resistance protein SugE
VHQASTEKTAATTTAGKRRIQQHPRQRTTSAVPIFAGTTLPPHKEHNMNWLILITAGLFEIVWAIGLKYTEGFSRFWPSALTLAAMAVSVGLLGIAMKGLPVGTAYAIWVGVGAVGTAILGIILFGEPANPARLLSLALIVCGIIGLKLATPA